MQENPFNAGYYTEDELQKMGFKSIGKNVRIAKNNTIVGLEKISIGDNVRIDGYCAIIASGDGFVDIGSYIHIGGWSYLSAGHGISLEDFVNISQGVRIYTRTDDYSGESLTNPMIPEKYSDVSSGSVVLKKHVIVGSGYIILPNLIIAEGASIGALSLVKENLSAWGIYCGVPAIKIKNRSKNLLKLEQQFLAEND